MPRPPTHHVHRGCHNCAKCFVMYEYGEGPEYYCTLSAPPRPPCGSVSMREDWVGRERDVRNLAYDTWVKWAKGRHG